MLRFRVSHLLYRPQLVAMLAAAAKRLAADRSVIRLAEGGESVTRVLFPRRFSQLV